MVKILASDLFAIDGLTLLNLNLIAKDIQDEKLKEQLKEIVKMALENKLEK